MLLLLISKNKALHLKNGDLQKYLQENELFENCIKQIRKDMNLDLQHLLQEKEGYAILFEEMKAFIHYNLKNPTPEFFNMLYKIDISEKRLKQALSMNIDDPIAKISQMIIEREVQKVIFRKLYK